MILNLLTKKRVRVLAPTIAIIYLSSTSRHGLENQIQQHHNFVPEVSIVEACDSSSTLSSFLSQSMNKTLQFSRQNPICPFSAYTHFHIAIPFYNLDEVTLTRAIKSVTWQHYPKEKITIWVYDDASSLSTSRQVLNNSCGEHSVIDFPTPSSADKFDDEFLAPIRKLVSTIDNPPQIICFRAARHLGPGGGKYWLFRLVKGVAKPNEVVVVLDGDDSFLHSQSLDVINQKYLDLSAWFTYGSYEGKWSEQIVDLPPSIRIGLQKFQPREQAWLYGHPRTFKVHLLDHITEHDFQFSDGNWLTKGTDRGFVYRMLELAGPDRIGYISKKIYKYEYSEVSSTLAHVSKEYRAAQLHHTRSMEPAEPLNLDLHVVLLLWKRIYLLEYQLQWLQDQIGLGGRRVHLHLVNNNPDEQLMVDKIVENLRISQINRMWLGELSLPMKVTLAHNIGNSYHNFARFVYVKRLHKEIPLDHVVFVDDDQYWHPTFLSSLIKEHKPKGMTTWYGKTFHRDSMGYTNYWKPSIAHFDVIRGRKFPEVSSFKYGGSGGSIFDSNLWLLDSQLMRPSRDLHRWAKVDDLWASYVIDALLGWDMHRLDPPTMPIDIGFYRENLEYRKITVVRIPTYIDTLLMGLDIPDHKNVRQSAVTRDSSIDKQNIFQELQIFFRWDVLSL